jgi:hypothetical protein
VRAATANGRSRPGLKEAVLHNPLDLRSSQRLVKLLLQHFQQTLTVDRWSVRLQMKSARMDGQYAQT